MTRRDLGRAALAFGAAAASGYTQVPSWSQFKPQPGSLKEKMHKGEQIRTAAAPVESTRAQLEEIIKKNGKVDLFSLDGQHRPIPDERELVKFCKLAEELGAGVQLRIQHQRLAYMTGRYADLGVLAIMVPLVEEVETANEAINNFYYPPLGNRSWGGEFRFGEKPPTDRLKYSQWWNGTGLLGFQIETLRAALNVRNIVKPGVDWISWGPGDMGFDIERHSNSPFKTLTEVHSFVIEQLKGYDVRVPKP
jgi:4-hydroxy-2-oxoheptanedioate aldolase